jgi:low-affinity inorganic phosphate transporter
VGFIIAALLLFAMKRVGWQQDPQDPEERLLVDGKKHPPFWARVTLICSAMG